MSTALVITVHIVYRLSHTRAYSDMLIYNYMHQLPYHTVEKWARCYCDFLHGDTDTDMYLEGNYIYVSSRTSFQ